MRLARRALRLLDQEVPVGGGRDLRQVRDAEHLRGRGELAQLVGQHARGAAADARVDLVEDEHLGGAAVARREAHGERDARELAARGDAAERAGGQARVGGQAHLDGVAPARAERRVGDRDLEARAVHAHVGEVALDALGERLARLLAPLAQRRREAIRGLLGRGDPGGRARDALVGALALGQLGGRRLGARAQLGRLVDAAEAPAQLRELLQPLLDAVEHRRIGIEAGQVRAQLDGRLAQLLGDARQLVAGPASAASCSRTRASTCAASPASATAPEPSSGLSSSAASLRRLEQHVEVAQPAALARELVLLARLRIDLLERRRRARAARPAGPARRPRQASASASARRAAASARQAACISLRRPAILAARGVQQVELHRGAHEPARLVLRDHLDQRLADALEVVARAAAAVEQRARAALAPDAAGDDVTPSAPSGASSDSSSGSSASENVAST